MSYVQFQFGHVRQWRQVHLLRLSLSLSVTNFVAHNWVCHMTFICCLCEVWVMSFHNFWVTRLTKFAILFKLDSSLSAINQVSVLFYSFNICLLMLFSFTIYIEIILLSRSVEICQCLVWNKVCRDSMFTFSCIR